MDRGSGHWKDCLGKNKTRQEAASLEKGERKKTIV